MRECWLMRSGHVQPGVGVGLGRGGGDEEAGQAKGLVGGRAGTCVIIGIPTAEWTHRAEVTNSKM